MGSWGWSFSSCWCCAAGSESHDEAQAERDEEFPGPIAGGPMPWVKRIPDSCTQRRRLLSGKDGKIIPVKEVVPSLIATPLKLDSMDATPVYGL